MKSSAPLVLAIAAVCAPPLAASAQGQHKGVIIRALADSAKVLESDTLQDIVVTSAGAVRRLNKRQVGAELIDIKEIANLPVVFGERDVMKSIQLLPGVKAESEGSTGYQVRGGTSAQNLVTLDNSIVYNTGHLMGLFSAFNDEALSGSTLYKGIVPARLGGGVSSVFEIGTRQGDMYDRHATVGIGVLAAKAMAEGPIKEGESSYLVAARKSYLDLFLKMTDDYKDDKLSFYDINGKVAWRIGDRDNISVSVIRSADDMDLFKAIKLKWDNTAVAARGSIPSRPALSWPSPATPPNTPTTPR